MQSGNAKILLVTASYPPRVGGLETVVSNLAFCFKQKNYNVTVITNKYPRNLLSYEEIACIPVRRLQFLYPQLVYLKTGRIDLWLAGCLFFPLTLFKFAIIILQLKPDYINLHYLNKPGYFLWILQFLFHFRFIVSLHGGDVDGEPYYNRFNRWLFRAVLKRAEQVTTCSQVLLDQALTLAPDIIHKTHVIHNGVNIEMFTTVHAYEHKCPYLLAVGQLEYHKGFDCLVDSFAQFYAFDGSLDLLIAGEGSQRRTLESKIESYNLQGAVNLLGAVERETVASLMRGCLAIVIPSRREPFGIVAVEAMAAGKPIIAVQVGGLVEALEGACVIWIPNIDLVNLVPAIHKIRKVSVAEKPVLEINRKLANQRSWEVVSDQYIGVFKGTKGLL